MIEDLLREAWSNPLPESASQTAHPKPKPLDPLHYGNGRFINPKRAVVKRDWKLHTPYWKAL